MRNIVLSLIIPVYKVENYIAVCLNSILSQPSIKEGNIELIIVNDGSPDNSMSIVEDLIKDKPCITVINQQNQGLSVARNTGLSHAKGEYVWFIDSDDWLLPNAIDDVLAYIDKHPEIPVFSTILERHVEKDNKIEQEYFPTKKELTGKEYLQLRYKQGASQRFIFKKAFLEKYNLSFYPGILHEDGLFGYQMLYWADKIRILERPVYAYRIRQEGSIMTSISIRTPKDMLFIHQQLIKFCKTNVATEDKLWYRLRIFSILINLFQFSKGLAFDSEFKQFYEGNKNHLGKEADFVMQNKTYVSETIYREALIIKYLPLTFMRIKYIARKILKR